MATVQVVINDFGRKLSPEAPIFIDPSSVAVLRVTIQPYEFMHLAEFCENRYLEIQCLHDTQLSLNLDFAVTGTALNCDIPVSKLSSGLYRMRLRYREIVVHAFQIAPEHNQSFFVTVNPPISREGISMCTVYSHALGPIDKWDDILGNMIDSKGFNMIHFTPINKFGSSGSCYSLSSWTEWHKAVGTELKLREFISQRLNKNGVLAMYDVVLNHVAPTARMLRANPGYCFNVGDYPYLLPAALLDMNLRVIEASILRNGWSSVGTGVFGDETSLTPETMKTFRKSKDASGIHAPGHQKDAYYDLQFLLSEHEKKVLTLYNLRCCYWEGADGEVGIHHAKASEFCHALTMFVGNVFDQLHLYEYELLDTESVVASFLDIIGNLRESEIHSFVEFCYSTVVEQYEKYTLVGGGRCAATLRMDRIFRAIGTANKTLWEPLTVGSCPDSLVSSRLADSFSSKSTAISQIKSVLDDDVESKTLTEDELQAKLRQITETIRDICRAINERVYARSREDRQMILSAIGGGVWYRLFVDVKPAFQALCFSDRPHFDIFMHGFQPILSHLDDKLSSDEILQHLEMNPTETLKQIESGKILCAACNGWVMGAAYDFTAREHRAYLRCNVITWGDCVKLAYYLPDGSRNKPLWTAALVYVERCASIFNSIRVDNAHSTDKTLLRHLLSAARRANQDIYIMLECFLGSADADANFLQEVGANSLVHELINVTSIGELCGTVVFGGEPIGQVKDNLSLRIPALMFDVTHDNNPPGAEVSYHQRENLLILAAIACSNCRGGMATTFLMGIGYPKKIEVTNPNNYNVLCSDGLIDMDRGFGLINARTLLSRLHSELLKNNYTQVYAHCHYDKLMTVERMNPATGESYIFVLRPAFKYNCAEWIGIIDIEFLGSYVRPYMYYRPDGYYRTIDDLQPDRLPFGINSEENRFVMSFNDSNFPKGSVLIFRKGSAREYSEIMSLAVSDANVQTFKNNFMRLPPFHQKWFLCQVCEDEGDYVQQGPYVFANDRGYLLPSYSGFDGIRDSLYVSDVSGPVAANIRYGDWLIDYICDRDQKYYERFCANDANTDDETREAMSSVLMALHRYVRMIKRIPTSLRPRCLRHVYAIFDEAINTAILVKEGLVAQSAISTAVQLTDLQLAFCHMYRASLSFIGFEPAYSNVDLKYANVVLSLLEQMDTFANDSLLTTLREDLYNEDSRLSQVSLCAGYPHFFRGMFRSWGRDIALSLTGVCTIHKSRQDIARQILVTSLSLLRHGLLPNLQDSGRRPRYNARDAVWFMLSALLDYIRYTGDESILDQAVVRFYPSDRQDDYELADGFYVLKDLVSGNETALCSRYIATIKELMIEILSRHHEGIHFREWNAGYQIDEHMRDEGFNIDIVVDDTYGLVSGGNASNCGTWMDKMGSCDWVNRGVPGSSRHGANIEINLCCLGVLDFICKKGKAFMPAAKCASQISFEAIEKWRSKLSKTLEDADGVSATHSTNPGAVISSGNDALIRTIHRQSKSRMLRDTITPDFLQAFKDCKDDKSKMKWRRVDPQNTYFRPNYFIGLSFLKDNESLLAGLKTEVSDGLHELHNGVMEDRYVIHARRHLKVTHAERQYGKPRDVVPWYMIGMRTVHHLDMAFRAYYDLHDSSSFETAGGMSYHNGPAWTHVYARAITSAILSGYSEPERLFINLVSFLNNHSNVNGSFKSVPELQQGDGSFCHASCTSQAWAVGGFAEALALLLKRK